MTRIKKVAIILLILNLVVGFLQMPIFTAIRGYARVVLMDQFYDLQSKGIINDGELKRQFNDQIIPTDLKSVAHFFLRDSLDLPVQIGITTTILYLINVLFLLWFLIGIGYRARAS